jgi:hypothetical protein
MRRLARCEADLQRERYRDAPEHQDVAPGAEKPLQPLSSIRCDRRWRVRGSGVGGRLWRIARLS